MKWLPTDIVIGVFSLALLNLGCGDTAQVTKKQGSVATAPSKADGKPQTVSQESKQSSSQTVVIPLDEVWTNEMPGTRNVFDLEPTPGSKRWATLSQEERTRPRKLLWEPIVNSLMERAGKRETIGAGFAVKSNDLEALRAAHGVLVDGKEPRESFAVGSDVTLVFFSYPSDGYHIHLKRIERHDDEIAIQYDLKPYFERYLSMGFALIPLGKLPVGKYRCIPTQIAMEPRFAAMVKKSLDEDWSFQFVCKPFFFSITDGPSKKP